MGILVASVCTFLVYNPNIDQPPIFTIWFIFYFITRIFGWIVVQIACNPLSRHILKGCKMERDYDVDSDTMIHSHSVWKTEGNIITTPDGRTIKSVYRGASMGGNTYDYDLKVQRRLAFDYLYQSIKTKN